MDSLISVKRLARQSNGAALVEISIGILILLTAVFFLIDAGRIGYEMVNLQQSVAETARWGSLGKIGYQASNRVSSIKARLRRHALAHGISINTDKILIKSISSDDATGSKTRIMKNDAGRSGHYLVVEATSDVRLTPFTSMIFKAFGGRGTIEIKGRSQVRNE